MKMFIRPFGKYGSVLLCLMLMACARVPEVDTSVTECTVPPQGRASAMCFALGDTVYIVGGRLEDNSYSSTMMTFCPASSQWQNNITTPLTARVNGVATCTAEAVYMGLGFAKGSIYKDETHLNDWWRFEPEGRKWKRLADFPSRKTVSAIAFANEQYVWVGFGFNGFGDELWRYSIAADQWEAVPHQDVWPERLMSPVAATCSGRIYQGTGFRHRGRTDWWEFFPDDQHWEKRASLPYEGRHNAACAATTEAVWVMGGWHYGDSLTDGYHFADILRYTPATNDWTRCGTMPCGVTENGVACAIGHRLYFGLGESDKSVLHLNWYCIEE